MPDEVIQELQDSLTPESEANAVNNPGVESAREEMIPKSSVDKLYARTKQAEEESRRVKQELVDLKAKQPSAAMSDDIRKELAVTRLVAQGYKEDEAEFILKAGGLENPYVKAGVEALRSKSRVEQAQPPASQVAAPAASPSAHIGKLKTEDKAKAWRDALDRAASKRAGQVM